MAQFALALRNGDIPVGWTNNFANYGLPLGLFAHQTTNYLGAVLILLTNQVILSYNLVLLVGAISSTLLCYLFLRSYFSADAALAGSVLFNFAPYRISNIYIRGALPEFWSSVFVWIILLGLFSIFVKKNWKGWVIFVVGACLLLLTHPMMFLISSTVCIPYALFLQLPMWRQKKQWHVLLKNAFLFCSGILIALLLAAYYLVPLTMEIKYFYHGLDQRHFAAGNYLSWTNYVQPENWSYFSATEIGPRGLVFSIGFIEILCVTIALVLLIFGKKKTCVQLNFISFALVSLALSIFLTLPQSDFLYQHFLPLNNIQFPWRFLSAVLFLPPMIAAWMITHIKYQQIAVIIFIFVIAVARFPQLYGKNYFTYDEKHFFFTPYNLHSNNLNTIWSGITTEYPIKNNQMFIAEGSGNITQSEVKNSWRKYEIEAKTPIRMVDNTFYFPGWVVLIDGQLTPIEFQDPIYRGMITYKVPTGQHQIFVQYQDTKIRKIAKAISACSVIIFLAIVCYLEAWPTRRRKATTSRHR